MLGSVTTRGRKVFIDPCSGNSYYQSVHNSVKSTPLFDVSTFKDKIGTNCKNSRLTLESQENDNYRKCYDIPEDTKYFRAQPLHTNSTRTAFWSRDDLAFSKSDIHSVELLSQIDKKFLCCVIKVHGESILVLFDQHAVHERIRLEELIADHHKVRGANTLGSIPTTVLSVLQSAACHGAIKFGDKLDRNTSISMLHSLTRCSLPFQCAHGRPSIAPLLNISKLKPNSDQYTVNCDKLKILFTRFEIKQKT